MQEVYKNGTEGEVHVADTLHELVPHILKSLQNPKVKFVKVFRAENKKRFKAEEEKKNIMEELEEELVNPLNVKPDPLAKGRWK